MSAGKLKCKIGLTSLDKLANSFGDSDGIMLVDRCTRKRPWDK